VVDTLVVVPCFNEAGRFAAEAFEACVRAQPTLSLVLVDDGSTDATAARLRELEARLPDRVEVLALARNAGKAEAVRAGVRRAFERAPTFVGYWDADLATPLDAIAGMRELLVARPGLDLVMGARVVLLGRDIRRRALRHYLGRMAATIISLSLGLRVYDTQCGAKLFRANERLRAVFEAPFRSRWLFDVELLARLIRAHGSAGAAAAAVCELPLERWTDVAGSKLRARDYLRALGELARIRRGLKAAPAVAPPPPR
jgi:glycosyltransferase involved in cell wall biosynthesis